MTTSPQDLRHDREARRRQEARQRSQRARTARLVHQSLPRHCELNYWRNTRKWTGQGIRNADSLFTGAIALCRRDIVDAKNAYEEGSRPGAKCSTPTRSTSRSDHQRDLMDMIRRYRHVLAKTKNPCRSRSSCRRDRHPAEAVWRAAAARGEEAEVKKVEDKKPMARSR